MRTCPHDTRTVFKLIAVKYYIEKDLTSKLKTEEIINKFET